eukprot:9499471-Prorocentrum_lima.AAC.1
MTSSLVGSEMCIRDRSRGDASGSSDPLGHTSTLATPGTESNGSLASDAGGMVAEPRTHEPAMGARADTLAPREGGHRTDVPRATRTSRPATARGR